MALQRSVLQQETETSAVLKLENRQEYDGAQPLIFTSVVLSPKNMNDKGMMSAHGEFMCLSVFIFLITAAKHKKRQNFPYKMIT